MMPLAAIVLALAVAPPLAPPNLVRSNVFWVCGVNALNQETATGTFIVTSAPTVSLTWTSQPGAVSYRVRKFYLNPYTNLDEPGYIMPFKRVWDVGTNLSATVPPPPQPMNFIVRFTLTNPTDMLLVTGHVGIEHWLEPVLIGTNLAGVVSSQQLSPHAAPANKVSGTE